MYLTNKVILRYILSFLSRIITRSHKVEMCTDSVNSLCMQYYYFNPNPQSYVLHLTIKGLANLMQTGSTSE